MGQQKLSDDQKEIENEKKREKRLENLDKERAADRARKRKHIENMYEVEREFMKIDFKHKKRTLRQQRTGKQKLEQNLKAKRGMRLFREEGRLYEQRTKRNRNKERNLINKVLVSNTN